MKKPAITSCLVVLLAASIAFAGCGSSVVGVYKMKSGDTTAVITLGAGGKGTYSIPGRLEGISITYQVKDGNVVIGAFGKTETGTYKIESGGLRDKTGNLYKKQ